MSRSLYPFIDQSLGGRLEEMLRGWRADGLSYEQMAFRLQTDHGIEVVGTTVARWYAALDPEPQSAA